jgi:RNA polymerase sigma-70 factor (ECF subfamily)
MLGSVADAEDVIQDAFLRWLDTDRSAVREPEAFLRRIVTRPCLDVLKSAAGSARPMSDLGFRSP